MNRCDFSSISTCLKNHISESNQMSQPDFLYELFEDFMDDPANQDFSMDNGLVCRWLTGQAKISPKISAYYSKPSNQKKLAETIHQNLLPLMSDCNMAMQDIYTLFIQDDTISDAKKKNLASLYKPASSRLLFLAKLISFGMERQFIKVLCPILFLTARVDEDDKINGLLSGGDDYITKPFSLRELEARIVTNIKREERHQQKTEYRFMDEMLIDYSEKIVAIAGHRMEFTKIEYQIIEFLSMHPGQVFDKERIYAQVCGYDAEGDSRTITELVRRIRKKIADYSEKEYIETVWGIGYRWKK